MMNRSATKIYYECRQVAEASNAQGLCGIVSDKFKFPAMAYTKIEGILDYIFQLSITEKPVFEKIGKYYYNDPVNHKNGEFDIVTEDADALLCRINHIDVEGSLFQNCKKQLAVEKRISM